MSESAENRTPRDVRDNDQGHAATKRRSRRGIRFGLLELLLLTAAIAAWLPVAIAHRQIKQLDLEIQTMATLTTDLVIMDELVWRSIRNCNCCHLALAAQQAARSWAHETPVPANHAFAHHDVHCAQTGGGSRGTRGRGQVEITLSA